MARIASSGARWAGAMLLCSAAGMLSGCAAGGSDDGVAWARSVKPIVEDRIILQQQRIFREEEQAQIALQLNAAEEKKIPYNDVVGYPGNWPDIVRKREPEAKSY